jgi:predicted transcriptional regulator
LERTIVDIESAPNVEAYRVEAVALILEMANTPYNSKSCDSNIQFYNAQMRLEEFVHGSNELLTNYLSIMANKGFIRYHKEEGLYTPTDKGMHFLKTYRMLSDFLR